MHSAKDLICFLMRQNRMHNIKLLYFFILLHTFSFCFSADTISIDKPIKDGELLVSKDKTFALGFFSPGKSTSRYVGIWYNNLAEQTVVWVANRDNPINDTSGVLSINPHGNLVIHHNYTTFPIWSTNLSLSQSNTTNVIAQLSDIANLVLILNHTKTVIWQSFDHPTDTFLPSIRLGFDRRTNQSWSIQSWKTEDDPGTGSYTLKFSTVGKPQLFLYHQNIPVWRGGSWNGEYFSGVPNMIRDMETLNFSFVEDDNQVALSFHPIDKSLRIRPVVQQPGFFQAYTWDNQKGQWSRYWSEPTNQCDTYGTCGSNSNCDPFNFENFRCTCLLGFEPKFPRDWFENKDGSGGCVRKPGVSVCENGEGFVKIEGLKLPDTTMAIVKGGLSLEECEKECLRNCSCTAYAVADVRNGGSGCLAWHGNLIDTVKLSGQGQDLFLRVDAVELANYYNQTEGVVGKKRMVLILVPSAVAGVILLSVYYLWKRNNKVSSVLAILLFDISLSQWCNMPQEILIMRITLGKVDLVLSISGYMSPEYAMEGRYSTKSDVFSFGVLLLEIIAGKRNTNSEMRTTSPNLIGYVWILWIQGRALDIVDSSLGQSYTPALVLRCIQIGLLCVQENATNRPSMLEVVFMLGNEAPLRQPLKPAFLFNENQNLQESSTSGGGSSINEVTETTIIAR
ncbi:hypothetical protein VNO77_05106 [Canavalia gladiata]|uniref:non-specific serine/threonine protein kinase n=1 Tax=Canavalia gladiata TaxID=3824 RepID=A0AAN9MZS3_CANGL